MRKMRLDNILRIIIIAAILLTSNGIFAFDFGNSNSHDITGSAPSDYYEGKIGGTKSPSSLTYNEYQSLFGETPGGGEIPGGGVGAGTDPDEGTPGGEGGEEEGEDVWVGGPVGDGVIPISVAFVLYALFVLYRKKAKRYI